MKVISRRGYTRKLSASKATLASTQHQSDMNETGTELYEEVKVEETERSKSDNKSIHGNKYTTLQRPTGNLIQENAQ